MQCAHASCEPVSLCISLPASCVLHRVACCAECRALALTIEELRALLSVVLGVSDLVLLFTLRALADEQLTADKATLNLQVLRKQVCWAGTVNASMVGWVGGYFGTWVCWADRQSWLCWHTVQSARGHLVHQGGPTGCRS